MEDIDPAAVQAYYRGDLEAMNPQEKAKSQIATRQKAEAAEQARRMEANDWTSLKKMLCRRYGTITSGWRECLDHGNNGKVSFTDFCKAARDLGFQGNAKKVFRELDEDHSGIITFNKVDPDWYARLSHFHEKIIAHFDSVENAWKALDSNGNCTVDANEFVPFCLKIGYDHDGKALFKQLLKNRHTHHLCPEDFEAKDCIIKANKADPNSRQQLLRSTTDSLSQQDLAKYHMDSRKAAVDRENSMRMGARDWPHFKDQLIHQYGTITAAWRHGLDAFKNGKISFTEFGAACRNHAFEGNIKQSFQEIDVEGRGVITFGDVDSVWFERHALFRQLLLAKYESYDNAWKMLDNHHNRLLEVDRFEFICKDIGYDKNPKGLFKQLLRGHEVHSLSPEDLDAGSMLVTKTQQSSSSPSSPASRTPSKSTTRRPSLA
jgi:Ca2+-binding EF-hand superfamily protein